MAFVGGGRVPPSQPQTAVNIDEELFDDDLDEEFYDDDPQVLTGVSRQRKKIVLTKRTYLLVAFVIITGLGVAGLILVYRKIEDWGGEYPPTVKCLDAFQSTMYALWVLSVITPIGFVILKFRVTNLMVGFMYMFILVVCIFFSMKGISNAYYSYFQDTDLTIHQFYASTYNTRILNDFWDFYQKQQGCCGTKNIDIVDDWPGFLKTSRLPDSCCTDEWIVELTKKYPSVHIDILRKHCAIGLGRVREHPLNPTLPKRIFSGFFLSLTYQEVVKLTSKFGLIHPKMYSVLMMDVRTKFNQTLSPEEAFQLNWKSFYVDSVYNNLAHRQFSGVIAAQTTEAQKIARTDEEYFKRYINKTKHESWVNGIGMSNDIVHPADLNHTNVEGLHVGLIATAKAVDICVNIFRANDTLGLPDVVEKIIKICKDRIHPKRKRANTLGRELLLRLDYLTTYIHLIADANDEVGEEMKKLERRAWALWKIPVTFNSNDIYPYTLTANLLRKENKKMYYLSRGIAENYILNGIVHNKTCELVKKEHLENMKKKLARDLNKRWRKYGKVAKWKNPDEGLGLFYLEFVHQVDFVCTIVGGSCIGCVIIIAVIFWQYYSRIKAEEYANLALPKEFEVLNLKRGSMIDEADIQRTVPKKKIKTNKVAPVSTPTAQMKGVVKGAVARRPGQQLPPRKAPPKHHQAGGGGAVRPAGGPRQAAPPVNNSRAPGRLAQPGGPR